MQFKLTKIYPEIQFFLPYSLLSSERTCDAVPSKVALSSELRATAIDERTSVIVAARSAATRFMTL